MLTSKYKVFFILLATRMVLCLAKYSLSGSAKYAVAQTPFTFTCKTGSTVDGISWNVKEIPFPIHQGVGTTCITAGAMTYYTYSCSGGMVFKLTVSTVSLSDHGSEWKCADKTGGSESEPIYMIVYAAIVTVNIQVKHSMLKPIDITDGIPILFSCYIYGARPAPKISDVAWYIKDPKGNTRKLTGTISKPTITDRRTFFNLKYIPRTQDNNHSVFCTATNKLMVERGDKPFISNNSLLLKSVNAAKLAMVSASSVCGITKLQFALNYVSMVLCVAAGIFVPQ